MSKLTTIAATAFAFMSATAASANPDCALTNTCPAVPEINAYAGVAAIAAVAAVVALIWERRRKAA